jgi:Putative Ig domain
VAQFWADNFWQTSFWAEGFWAQVGDVPVITTLEPANGAVDVAYTFQFQATGDVPITWTVSVGAAPTGLSLSSTGLLSGTPTGTGTTNFTVQATNAQGSDTLACSLVVGTAATGDGTDRAARSRTQGRGLLRLVGR